MIDEDPRVTEANIKQAEANANKAATEAAAAERAETEASSALAQQQREAEAKKAIAEANEAARQADVAIDPALQQQQKEAEARKAIAEANKSAFDAHKSQISSLIPDFGAIQIPETKVSGDQAARSNDLTRHALRAAADRLAEDLDKKIPNQNKAGNRACVLITSDPDLASTDGAYVEVKTGLDRLIQSSDALLAPPQEQPPAPGLAPLVLAAAAASAIPGLISVLAPRRSLASYAIADDDTAAVADVAGALSGARDVQIDNFRLVPEGVITGKEAELRSKRDQLARHKLEQEQTKADKETQRSNAQDQLTALLKLQAGPPPTGSAQDLDEQITQARGERDTAAADAAQATVSADLADELLKAIDAFILAIHTVPQGATRSPFVSAALHEEMRAPAEGDEPKYDAVLYVKGSGGSVDQFLEKIFIAKDRLEVVASISLSYWAMDPRTNNIVAAGVATASSRLTGKIGDELKIEPIEPSTS